VTGTSNDASAVRALKVTKTWLPGSTRNNNKVKRGMPGSLISNNKRQILPGRVGGTQCSIKPRAGHCVRTYDRFSELIWASRRLSDVQRPARAGRSRGTSGLRARGRWR